MGKKKKRHLSLMKEWPSDNECVSYDALIFPIKKILFEGYKIERLPNNHFVYTGYNIGETERAFYSPTPAERFDSRWLENEAKFKRTLLDNALMVVFQLGMEQCRRLEKSKRESNQLLHDIIVARTKTVQKLREKLSQYEPAYGNQSIPLEHENDELMDICVDSDDDDGNKENSKNVTANNVDV